MGQHPWMLKQGGSSGHWDAALGAEPPEQSLPTPRSCGWCGEGTDPRQTPSLRPRGCQVGQAGESWGEKVGSGWASATLGERLNLPRPISSLATWSYWDLCLRQHAQGTARKAGPAGLRDGAGSGGNGAERSHTPSLGAPKAQSGQATCLRSHLE